MVLNQKGLFDPILDKYVDFDNYDEFFYPADGLKVMLSLFFRRENIEKFERSQRLKMIILL